ITDACATVAPMIQARQTHSATLLADGRVLIAGGCLSYDESSATASAEIYDPTTNTWSPAASMPVARYGHLAALLHNGKVLIMGGLDTAGQPIGTTPLYDPATNSWSTGAAMGTARFATTLTRLSDGKLLVAGGSIADHTSVINAEIYDPASDSWSVAAAL